MIARLWGVGFTHPPLWLQPLIPNSTCWSPGAKSHVQSTAGKILCSRQLVPLLRLPRDQQITRSQRSEWRVNEAIPVTEQFGLFSVQQVFRQRACLWGEAKFCFLQDCFKHHERRHGTKANFDLNSLSKC